MSYRIRWLHLSDFHLGKDNYGQLKLFRSILDQIKARVAKSPLDFVFITGDVAQSGTAEQYELFHRECLEPLQQLVGQDCQILIVPGNHDLDRTQAEFVSREKMQKSLNFFDASGSSQQGCNLAGESPVVSVARIGHVAMPHPGVGNQPGYAWCKRPGCPARYCGGGCNLGV